MTEEEMDYFDGFKTSEKDTQPEFSNHGSNEIFSDYCEEESENGLNLKGIKDTDKPESIEKHQ